MKRLAFVVLLLSLSCTAQIKGWKPVSGGGGGTCCTFVNSTAAATGPTVVTSVATPSFNAVAGNLIVVTVSVNQNDLTGVSISDTAGNTYTLATSNVGSSVYSAGLYYAKNITGNANNVVTLHFAGTNYSGLTVQQFSGASTTAPLDQTFNTYAAYGGTSITSPSFTTTAANEVLVGGIATSPNNTFTAGSGYIIAGDTDPTIGIAQQYKFVTSIQTGVTMGMTGTTAAEWAIVGATFK